MDTSAGPPFAPPRDVTDPKDCWWYHTFDLPGHGEVNGYWDLRGREEAYLGGFPVGGKRVLEVGTASGQLCRFMEGRGAEVVAFDAAQEIGYDVVPFPWLDVEGYRAELKDYIRRMTNGWWLARKLQGWTARVVYGTAYDIPAAIGPVDVSTFGAILLHLQNPFLALSNATRLTRGTVIVTELYPAQPAGSVMPTMVAPTADSGGGVLAPPDPNPGAVYFVPDGSATDPGASVHWWSFPPEVIRRMLAALGFGDSTVTMHNQRYLGTEAQMYTVVAHRTRGTA